MAVRILGPDHRGAQEGKPQKKIHQEHNVKEFVLSKVVGQNERLLSVKISDGLKREIVGLEKLVSRHFLVNFFSHGHICSSHVLGSDSM